MKINNRDKEMAINKMAVDNGLTMYEAIDRWLKLSRKKQRKLIEDAKKGGMKRPPRQARLYID